MDYKSLLELLLHLKTYHGGSNSVAIIITLKQHVNYIKHVVIQCIRPRVKTRGQQHCPRSLNNSDSNLDESRILPSKQYRGRHRENLDMLMLCIKLKHCRLCVRKYSMRVCVEKLIQHEANSSTGLESPLSVAFFLHTSIGSA